MCKPWTEFFMHINLWTFFSDILGFWTTFRKAPADGKHLWSIQKDYDILTWLLSISNVRNRPHTQIERSIFYNFLLCFCLGNFGRNSWKIRQGKTPEKMGSLFCFKRLGMMYCYKLRNRKIRHIVLNYYSQDAQWSNTFIC